jgi:hypothetical protein
MAPNNGMHFLVTIHLVGYSTEQAGSILFHLLNDETFPAYALLKPPVSLRINNSKTQIIHYNNATEQYNMTDRNVTYL